MTCNFRLFTDILAMNLEECLPDPDQVPNSLITLHLLHSIRSISSHTVVGKITSFNMENHLEMVMFNVI